MSIIVASHRRSGTHLTIDSIINNFKPYSGSEVINLDTIFPFHENHAPLSVLQKDIERNPFSIIKTHLLPNPGIYDLGEQEKNYIGHLFANNPVLYAYRNGLDVMISLYKYMQQYDEEIRRCAFSDFIFQPNNFDPVEGMNRMEFWKYHVSSWTSKSTECKVLPIRFEDWLRGFEGNIAAISGFISLEPNKALKNIELSKQYSIPNRLLNKMRQMIPGLKGTGPRMTSILPDSGKSDNWKKYFDQDLLDRIPPDVVDYIGSLGYDARSLKD